MKKNDPQMYNEPPRREHLEPDVIVAEQEEKKSRHIVAKILCLILAVIVWLYVMNLESTDYERTFTDVPVVLDGVATLNASGDMSVISGYDNTVDVTVSGKKSEVQALTAEDIRVAVDLSTLTEAGKFTLPVTVQLPTGMTVLHADGLTADIYVDVNTTREIPVRITNLDYIINSAYTLGTPELSLETVTVTGPQQVLELIDCAALSFDLGNVTASTTMVGTPSLIDADGVKISNPYVRCNANEITVVIPVWATKTVKLTAAYALPELASGWLAEITPATITVKGDPTVLSTLEEIPVYTIAVNATEGEYTVGASAIELPEGVSCEEIPESIRVRVRKIVG